MASLKKRGDVYYLQYYSVGQQRRVCLETESFQVAKEKLRRFESSQAIGSELPLPTQTPIAEIVSAYVQHIRSIKTAKSAQTDIYYLRDMFGPICDALKITSRKVTEKVRKRPIQPGEDRRRSAPLLEADCLEKITTAAISIFISGQVARRGLAPKTANRYREILSAMFNWAMTQRGVRMPNGKNPAEDVMRYKEAALSIRFLTLVQIQEQLQVLSEHPHLQAMVATYIYAGLRREELLWLTHDDIDWNAEPYGLIRVRAKTIDEVFWQPKTKVNRVVPIASALRPFLDRQRVRSAGNVWLFPSPNSQRWDPDNFSADLRDANRAAKLSWACLDFRHTFGSQLAMKSENLQDQQVDGQLTGNLPPPLCRIDPRRGGSDRRVR